MIYIQNITRKGPTDVVKAPKLIFEGIKRGRLNSLSIQVKGKKKA